MNEADKAKAVKELELLQIAFDQMIGRQSIRSEEDFRQIFGDPEGSEKARAKWKQASQRISGRVQDATSRLPTVYENPYLYLILEDRWKAVEEVIPSNDPQRSHLDRVQIGTVASGDVNASILPVPQSNALLLLFHSSIPEFVHLLLKPTARVLGLAKPFDCSNKPREEMLRWVFDAVQTYQAGSLDRFRECLTATVVLGRPEFASPYAGGISESFVETMNLMLHSAEVFIVAHEIGHLLAGHLEEKRKMNVVLNNGNVPFAYYLDWMREFEADGIGAELCAGVMSRILAKPAAPLYLGPFIFFACVGVLERCIAILETGEDVAQPSRWKPPTIDARFSHPPSWMRAHKLLDRMRKSQLPAVKEFEFARDSFTATIDLLWQMSEPYFIQLHREGNRPSARWRTLANQYVKGRIIKAAETSNEPNRSG